LPANKTKLLAAALLVFNILAAVTIKLLGHTVAALLPDCLLKTATGLNCPSCGATHAIKRLTDGDVAGALYYNPLLVIVLALYILWCVYFALRAFGLLKSFKIQYRDRYLYAAAATVLLFWIVRNLPLYRQFLY